MTDKLKELYKNEKIKKGIDKIRKIPPRYGYIALAIIAVILSALCVISIVTRNTLNDIANEVLPQSLITFHGNNNFIYVTNDVQLLQEFEYNGETYTIQWKSDNQKVIDNFGIVNRPNGDNEEVALTASIKKGIASIEFPYQLTVISSDIINAAEMQSLTAEAIMDNNTLRGIKFDKNSLILNSDINTALFAEYYINKLFSYKFINIQHTLNSYIHFITPYTYTTITAISPAVT